MIDISDFNEGEKEILKELANKVVETILQEFVDNEVELKKNPESDELNERRFDLREIIESQDFKNVCELAGYGCIEHPESLINGMETVASRLLS